MDELAMLATLILLKASWLPLVITRKERPEYIAALRAADNGDLSLLVNLFGSLQRKAIREALSLTEEVIHEATAISGILASVKAKFSRQREVHSALIRRAYDTADSLQVLAAQRLREVADEIHASISGEGPGYKAFMFEGLRNSERSKYHYHRIINCANSLDYFANLRRHQAWSALGIITEQRTEILFSFHGIGYEESGILGCSAMAYMKERSESGETMIGPVTPLVTEPFEFTYSEDSADVQKRFRKWLDQCLIAGLDYWQRSI